MTDRNAWKTGLSIGLVGRAALEKAADAGLDLVEIFGVDGDRHTEDGIWKSLAGWSKETGVDIWSIHLPFGDAIKCDVSQWDPVWWNKAKREYTRLICRASEAGAKVAVLHGSVLEPIPRHVRESMKRCAVDHMGILLEVCRENGMTLALEDLPRTCLGNTSDEILEFIGQLPDLRVCFDVNHLLQEDHTSFIEKLGKYIVTTHISDYDFVDEKHWFPMDGKIDWKKLQEDLERADYSGPFLYETMPYGKTWADVRKNFEMLKKL